MKSNLLLLPLLLLLACGESKSEQPIAIKESTIIIKDGWVRPGKANMMTAAFFKIENNTAVNDSLLSVESDVTDNTEIHESYEMEGGMMGMRPIGLIPVGAGDMAELKPGGMHIMIIKPFKDVAEGDSVHFTLTFSEFGEKNIALPIVQRGGGGTMNH